MVENVIIIGGGPAGLSAAIYTAREGFNPLVIAGSLPGGQLLNTTIVENIPGFPEGIEGPEYINRLNQQATKFGARIINEDARDIDIKNKPFKVMTSSNTYEAKSIIIATGANPKKLGIPGEDKFTGRGVSTCATCDAAFFKNKNVVVVGGGDTAMEDADFLTRFANHVTIIHRRDSFRASKIMQERVFNNKKIDILWNTVVKEIKGDTKVRSIIIENLKTNETKEMSIDGVFVAIGYAPNTSFLIGKLELDEQGYIKVEDDVITSIKGVFAAGDVADKFYRQATTAAAAGVKAALRVREYLRSIE